MQITPQKRPAGTQIKSNFYFGLIGYFLEIRDYIGLICAGEHVEPAESDFDEEKVETGPELGVFLLMSLDVQHNDVEAMSSP